MFEYRSFCHRLFLDPAPCWSSDPAFSRQFRANDMSEHWKRLGDPMCPTILVYDDMTYTAHLGTHTKFGKMIKKSSCFFGGCRFFPHYHWYHHRLSCTWGNAWPPDFPLEINGKKLASLSRLQLRHYIITGWWLPLVTWGMRFIIRRISINRITVHLSIAFHLLWAISILLASQ